MTDQPKARRGFGAMDPEKQRAIARKGGAAVPNEKRSYSQNRELAATSGRKGGQTSHADGHRGAAAQDRSVEP